MGLFVAENGHYQGWLAAFLCCCAALNDDEYPIEKDGSRRKVFLSWPRYVVLTGQQLRLKLAFVTNSLHP